MPLHPISSHVAGPSWLANRCRIDAAPVEPCHRRRVGHARHNGRSAGPRDEGHGLPPQLECEPASAGLSQFAGRRVLLVEDEFYQAMEVEELLRRWGMSVIGPAADEDAALRLLGGEPVDAAILDINLGRGASYAIARNLRQRGIPFVFLTGYDVHALPADMAGVPKLDKPSSANRILACLARLLA